MTVQTLRPNGVTQAGAFTAVGAASLNAATSDNSDASYAQSSTVVNNAMALTLGTYTLLSNQRVKLTRLRVRGSASAGSASFMSLHHTNNLFWGTSFAAPVTTTPTTYTSTWMTPPTEVTQALIDDLRMSALLQYTDGVALLRVQELYLDLDVRDRPVIDSFSASTDGDTATFSLTFTYGTNAVSETVTIRVDIYDELGALVDSTSTVATGIDFAAAAVSFDYTSPFGTYTAVATVLAGGFVAPTSTFDSATAEVVYNILPAGVEPPILVCSTDQGAQTVTLDISQADNILPPSVDCLRIETFTQVVGTSSSEVVAETTVGEPRHIAVWLDDVLVTGDVVFGATSVTVTLDTSVIGGGTVKLVVATTGGGASNVNLQVHQLNEPLNIVHNLNTTDLIVQARVASSSLQAEIGVTIVDVNTIAITGPFTIGISVLILSTSADPVCVPTIDAAIAADTDDQVVVHQYSSLLTLATFVRTSDNRVSWLSVEMNPGNVEVDNDGGAGTIHLSGFLATFDDPDAVRAEVRRDGALIPLDDLNGALVPPFGEGSLIVTDRFPERFPAPLCDGDPEPTGPLYQVRFYGYVDGLIAFSPWAECTPPAVIHNGNSLLRHPLDESLDVEGCTTTENWQRTRPQSIAQSVGGGIPAVRAGTPGGRDFTLLINASTTPATLAIEALLADLYFWYSPIDPLLTAAWLAPTSQQGYTPAKMVGRPADVALGTVEVEPDPVILPPAGPPAS
jgi:hypothetical protein